MFLMAEEAKAPVDRWNSWGGIAERSHLVIKLSVHLLIKSVLYSYEGGEGEAEDGSRSGIRLGPKTLGGDMIKDWNAPREKGEKEVVWVREKRLTRFGRQGGGRWGE